MRRASRAAWPPASSAPPEAWPRAGAGPAAVGQLQRGTAHPAASPVRILDNILFAAGALQVDRAVALQLPHHADDLLLRGFDLLNLPRPQRVHVFQQHLGPALRETFHEVFAHQLAGTLERQREYLAVHFGQDLRSEE